MALLLREVEVERCLEMAEVMDAVDLAMGSLGRGEAQNQPRRRVFPSGGLLNVMFASLPEAGLSGVKAYTVADGAVRFLLTIFGADGRPVALIEANGLGAYRTGAASGVAARHLAPAMVDRIAILGTGWQGHTQLLALALLFPSASFSVFGRDPERRQRFAANSGAAAGVPVTAAGSARECVEGADLVVTMTNSATPVLESAWVRPGALVIGAGCNFPQRSELPAELVDRADLVVVDQRETAALESGDLLQAGFDVSRATELGAIVAGSAQGRQSGEQMVLFESHGLALWDVAAAACVMARARELRIGEEINLLP